MPICAWAWPWPAWARRRSWVNTFAAPSSAFACAWARSSQAQFNRFLPGQSAIDALVAAVRTYVGEEKGWDVQLVLKKEEVPLAHLGQAGRMGLSMWMGRYRKSTDADQVVLNPVR